jgi:hypothetical protein
MREPLPYAGGTLDRAASYRSDPTWIEAKLAGPSAMIIPMWSDKCLVTEAGPVRLARSVAGACATLIDAPGRCFRMPACCRKVWQQCSGVTRRNWLACCRKAGRD